MTFNTGNPIGSTDSRDRLDNTENMDYLENSITELTHPDRLGNVRRTRHGMEVEHDAQISAHESEHDAQIAAHESEHDAQIAAHESEHDAQMQSFENDFDGRLAGMAFTRVGSFTTGATLTDMRQVLVWEASQGGDGHEYGWAGAFPKVVTAGATPATSGGIAAGAWVDRTDVTLRSDLASESGSGLVGYQPAGNGAVSTTVQSKLRESVSVKDFGAVGDGLTDDTDAIQAAVTFCENNNNILYLDGRHLTSSPIYVTKTLTIESTATGSYRNRLSERETMDGIYNSVSDVFVVSPRVTLELKKVRIKGTGQGFKGITALGTTFEADKITVHAYDCQFDSLSTALDGNNGGWVWRVIGCSFIACSVGVSLIEPHSTQILRNDFTGCITSIYSSLGEGFNYSDNNVALGFNPDTVSTFIELVQPQSGTINNNYIEMYLASNVTNRAIHYHANRFAEENVEIKHNYLSSNFNPQFIVFTKTNVGNGLFVESQVVIDENTAPNPQVVFADAAINDGITLTKRPTDGKERYWEGEITASKLPRFRYGNRLVMKTTITGAEVAALANLENVLKTAKTTIEYDNSNGYAYEVSGDAYLISQVDLNAYSEVEMTIQVDRPVVTTNNVKFKAILATNNQGNTQDSVDQLLAFNEFQAINIKHDLIPNKFLSPSNAYLLITKFTDAELPKNFIITTRLKQI